MTVRLQSLHRTNQTHLFLLNFRVSSFMFFCFVFFKFLLKMIFPSVGSLDIISSHSPSAAVVGITDRVLGM